MHRNFIAWLSVTGFPVPVLMAWLWSWIHHGPLIICLWLCARMDYAHAWTSAPVLKVWLHAHSCHLALALLVAISILYVRVDQALGGARHIERIG
jgi:hypothetical protein